MSPSQYCFSRGTLHNMENKRNIVRYRIRGLCLLLRKEPTLCPHLWKVHSHAYPVPLVHFGTLKHLRLGFVLFLPATNFLISERIKCCCFFNIFQGLLYWIWNLLYSHLLCATFFFNCNQNTICAEICYMRFLLWISTISIKHYLKSISHFGHKDKLNSYIYLPMPFFPLAFMVFWEAPDLPDEWLPI